MSITSYLNYCTIEKKLRPNTIKAYNLDLNQFQNYLTKTGVRLNLQDVKKNISSIIFHI